MRLPLRILLILLLAPPLIAAVIGWLVVSSFLHPVRRPLTPDLVQQADVSFAQIGVRREARFTPLSKSPFFFEFQQRPKLGRNVFRVQSG